VAGTLLLGVLPKCTETLLTSSQEASALETTSVPIAAQASASAR
jgi:hypothetical protein